MYSTGLQSVSHLHTQQVSGTDSQSVGQCRARLALNRDECRSEQTVCLELECLKWSSDSEQAKVQAEREMMNAGVLV